MMANIIPAEAGLKEITSEFTLSSDVTWNNSNTKIYEKNGIVYFTLRGQFKSTLTSGDINLVTIPSQYKPIVTMFFPMFDTDDWNNPTIHATVNTNSTSSFIVVNGLPEVAGKKFAVTGIYPVI